MEEGLKYDIYQWTDILKAQGDILNKWELCIIGEDEMSMSQRFDATQEQYKKSMGNCKYYL